MTRIVGVMALGLAAIPVVVAGLGQEPRQQPPIFRASTEIVLIETQVVARDGRPIPGLKADQFEVFIDGRRRPVVSAEFLRATGPYSGGAGELAQFPTRVVTAVRLVQPS